MPIEWYVRLGNVERGPISSEMLKQLALKGKIKPEMLLRKGQSGNWVPASRGKGLFARTCDQDNASRRRPVCTPLRPGSCATHSCATGGPTGSRARYCADGRSPSTVPPPGPPSQPVLSNRRPHRLPCQIRRRRKLPAPAPPAAKRSCTMRRTASIAGRLSTKSL